MSEENTVPEVNTEAQAAEARKFGWVPQEEFKGDPSQWRDADEFLKRGREINGYLRKDLEKITGKNAQLESELREVKEVMKEFKKFHEETEDRAYKRALTDLKKQKVEAIQTGDAEAVIAIDEQLDELKEARQTKPTEAPAPNNAAQQAILNEWIGENTWIQSDIALQAAANGFTDIVRAENPGLVGRAFLDKVKEKVQEAFPDKFRNTTRDIPSAVEGGTSTARSTTTKKSYANLPAEAKSACDRFVKQGLMTQEQYITEYFQE